MNEIPSLDRSLDPEVLRHIAPNHFEGLNVRGHFSFPMKRFADRLLPSSAGRPPSPRR